MYAFIYIQVANVRAGEVYAAFRFDPELCHSTLIVNERGRRVLKREGLNVLT